MFGCVVLREKTCVRLCPATRELINVVVFFFSNGHLETLEGIYGPNEHKNLRGSTLLSAV